MTVHPELHVREAAALLCKHRLVRVPVVDASERLTGIISRADLVRAVAGGPTEQPLVFPQPPHLDGTTAIGTIMMRDVPAVRADASLRAVVDAVVSTRLNRAVVTDQEDRVLGIVTDAELIDRLTPALHPGVLASVLHRIPLIHRTPEEEAAWRHATGNRAGVLMLRDIVVAREQEAIREVLARVYQTQRQVVPIVNDTERLVGIVDRLDLLSVLVGRSGGQEDAGNP
jgi:CBS domain-containing protein